MEITKENFRKFAENFKKTVDECETFLIMPHINMDGDALGSALAMLQVLESLGKKPFIYTTDEVAGIYKFLPFLNKVSHRLPDKPFDCAILLECPNYDRCPAGDNFKAKVQINIDHHPDNHFYADYNWVDTDASSIGEMIYELYEELGYPIPKETALCLYVAIFTDTGAFQYSKTSHRTHRVIAEMLKKYSLPLEEIGRKVYREMDQNVFQLLARLMLETRVYPEGFAVTVLPRSMMEEFKVNDADAQNLVRDLNVIRDVHTVVFIRETANGTSKASLRSSRIPINGIAGRFGGGGHERAAGCTIKLPLEQVREVLVSAVREMLSSGCQLPA